MNDMKHLDYIKHFFRSQAPCLLVAGQSGCGKSALLRDAIAQSGGMPLPVIYVPSRSSVNSIGLLGQIAQTWSLPMMDREAPFDRQLTQLVHWLEGHQQTGILVIDDAHLLPYSLLAALVRVLQAQSFDHCHLKCVLSGKPSLVEKVQVICNPPCDVLRLDPVTLRQVEAKVNAFLAQAGVQAKGAHVQHVANRLYRQSHGDMNSLERSLQSLSLQDFIHHKSKAPSAAKASHASQVLAVDWASFMKEHAARFIALTGLCFTIGVMYWREQMPTYHSPHLPSKPYHFALSQPQPTLPGATPALNKIAAAHQAAFTVQLLGSFSQSDIKQFISAHHLQSTARIYHATYDGRPWYVLGYGAYSSRAAADAARDQLPTGLSHQGAWVRSIH